MQAHLNCVPSPIAGSVFFCRDCHHPNCTKAPNICTVSVGLDPSVWASERWSQLLLGNLYLYGNGMVPQSLERTIARLHCIKGFMVMVLQRINKYWNTCGWLTGARVKDGSPLPNCPSFCWISWEPWIPDLTLPSQLGKWVSLTTIGVRCISPANMGMPTNTFFQNTALVLDRFVGPIGCLLRACHFMGANFFRPWRMGLFISHICVCESWHVTSEWNQIYN